MNTDRIRSRAKECGISLSFLCEKMGVARVYFNDIENTGREIPPEKMHIIARTLSTTPEYLTYQSDNAEPQGASEEEIKAALFQDSEYVTDEMWEEVKRFAAYLSSREQTGKKNSARTDKKKEEK